VPKIVKIRFNLLFTEDCGSSFPDMVYTTGPHRGLPPCRGGGAYALMTRTII